MTVIESSVVPVTQSGLVVKMEDRKRPAAQDPSDSTPPLKKQATTVNGGGKSHPDADMPWRDDLEVCLHCGYVFFFFSKLLSINYPFIVGINARSDIK